MAHRELRANVAWGIENELAVLLEWLPRQNLGEEVSRVRVTRDMASSHHPSTPQLTHLEHLAIDVAGVLGRREPVAKIVCCLAVSADFDWSLEP